MCGSLDLSPVGWFQSTSLKLKGRGDGKPILNYFILKKQGYKWDNICLRLRVRHMEVSNPCFSTPQQCHLGIRQNVNLCLLMSNVMMEMMNSPWSVEATKKIGASEWGCVYHLTHGKSSVNARFSTPFSISIPSFKG